MRVKLQRKEQSECGRRAEFGGVPVLPDEGDPFGEETVQTEGGRSLRGDSGEGKAEGKEVGKEGGHQEEDFAGNRLAEDQLPQQELFGVGRGVTGRANESLFKTQFVPLDTPKQEEQQQPKKNSFFKTMTDLSKISSNRTRLFESKDFGNYTHNRSFSLYDPVNHLGRKDESVNFDPRPELSEILKDEDLEAYCLNENLMQTETDIMKNLNSHLHRSGLEEEPFPKEEAVPRRADFRKQFSGQFGQVLQRRLVEEGAQRHFTQQPERRRHFERRLSREGNDSRKPEGVEQKGPLKESHFFDMIDMMQKQSEKLNSQKNLLDRQTEGHWFESLSRKKQY